MPFKEFIKSNYFKIILATVVELAALLLVFQAGVFVGFRKANFSFGWGENYHRTFGGPREGFMPNMREVRGDDFISGHGIAGTIIKLDNSSIVMKDNNGMERIVTTSDKTSIKNGTNNIALQDLKTDDHIVVLGVPEKDGSINARMIRFFSGDFPPVPGPKFNGFMGGGQPEESLQPTNTVK